MNDWKFSNIADAKRKVDDFGDQNDLSAYARSILLEAVLSVNNPSKEGLLNYFEREIEAIRHLEEKEKCYKEIIEKL